LKLPPEWDTNGVFVASHHLPEKHIVSELTPTAPPTAIVTGASRGIGKAVALRLAAAGLQLFVVDRCTTEESAEVCAEIVAAGGAAQAFCLDVTDSEAVTNFFKEQVKGKVRLDVLVNNAGITKDGLIMRMKDEDFQRVLSVNLSGAFYCLREATKIMTKQRSGSIVNIASVAGQSGNAGQANYASSKAGLIGLTKSAAQELGGRGITVNAVAPGYIETDMTAALPQEVREEYVKRVPLRRAGTVKDVADAVAWLASGEASYITGQVLAVNGGMYM
jgi:3-oxoacyl-[acyl-carrier protein] reductase